MPNLNCSCDEGFYGNETLGDLRRSIIIRLGYAAQVNNPPPGMAELVDDFLRRGQTFLYRKYRALHTKRWFKWEMEVGERFYDIPDSILEGCTKRLDATRIEAVWVEDLNGTFTPVAAGINPGYYTMAAFNGLPARYEVRQCIEVLPGPSAEYNLWVLGHFGCLRFTEDDDPTTLDSELVFLWALAKAKAHYGQPDAKGIEKDAKDYLRDLVHGTHTTTRYVPGTIELPPETPPVFLPLAGP